MENQNNITSVSLVDPDNTTH